MAEPYTTRRAELADLPALLAVHDSPSHERRLTVGGYSYHPDNCVLVVEEAGIIVGSVHVVFARPSAWPDAGDKTNLPCISSLVVREDRRNRGAGTALVHAVERLVVARGLDRLHLSVEDDNAGALRLYLRLGYKLVADEPRRVSWRERGPGGATKELVEWHLDLVKQLVP